MSRRPGMTPVRGSWIVVDDAYEAQMTERSRLLATRRGDVVQSLQGSESAQAEVLEMALSTLPVEFYREGGTVHCPDGRIVRTDAAPFDVLAALLQEDLLLLERREDEHVLIAGLLCFPASWTLAEKLGRPLTRIHTPVPEYDERLSEQVQRLFDRAPPGRAMWRANALGYADATLHQPRTEVSPRDADTPARYLRCERQTVLRLPITGAVLFAVHTYVVSPQALTQKQKTSCPLL